MVPRKIQVRALILAITVFLLNTAGRFLWSYVHNVNIYDICDAISWVLVFVFLSSITKGIKRTILVSLSLLVISSFLDEICFNPTETGYNEWIFLAIITIWTVFRIRRRNL